MFPLIFIWLSAIYTCFATEKRFLEVEMNLMYGPQGCRQQCEDRMECLEMKYSSFKLKCNLHLNVSTSNSFELKVAAFCSEGYCIQRWIQTRSGRRITVLEKYEDKNPQGNWKNGETKLGFVSLTKQVCNSSGKENSTLNIQHSNGYKSGCRAMSKQAFLKNINNTWMITASQEGNEASMVVRFYMKSTSTRQVMISFYLRKLARLWKFGETMSSLKTMYSNTKVTLRFTLSGEVLRVVEGRNNTFLSAIRLDWSGTKMRLFILVYCKKNVALLSFN